MILVDSVKFYPYLLLLADQDPVLGLDPRSIDAIEVDWTAKWKLGADRQAKHDQALARAGIANEQLVARKIENPGDPVLSAAGVGEAGVSLEEVAPPPPEELSPDEVLRLEGDSGGYGAVSVMASVVVGVARAWGEEADDFCRGVPTRKVGGKKKSKKRRAS